MKNILTKLTIAKENGLQKRSLSCKIRIIFKEYFMSPMRNKWKIDFKKIFKINICCQKYYYFLAILSKDALISKIVWKVVKGSFCFFCSIWSLKMFQHVWFCVLQIRRIIQWTLNDGRQNLRYLWVKFGC